MPRRKKEENMSYEERISQINSQIEQCKETVSQLRSQRRQLQKEQDEKAMQQIYDYIRASDMSPEQFLSQLQQDEKHSPCVEPFSI
ncbi:MAG: DUF4315 family protein [Oscillospiraceae bacterium]|jgi:predicted RNase H-like nuclease (RuvC/YqgF family)|nr:DUF4315 family protein [Oscillospiraceae bacterium]